MDAMFVAHFTLLSKSNSGHWKGRWRNGGGITRKFHFPNNLISLTPFIYKMKNWTRIASKSTSSYQTALFISLPENTPSSAKYEFSTPHIIELTAPIFLHFPGFSLLPPKPSLRLSYLLLLTYT